MKKALRIFSFVFSLIILLSAFSVFAFSASVANPMTKTNVVSDLNAMGYNLSKYPKDTSADFVSIIDFTEYGFDYNGDQRYYGLYIYLYNPTGAEILDTKNYLQMKYIDTSGARTSYVKHPLTVLSVSTSPGYEGVFYKLKVESTNRLVRQIARGQRVYILSGIELNYSGSGVTDFPLKSEYSFTGNQDGFTKDDSVKGNLYCKKDVFEVIEIELGEACWFSDTSSLGEDYRWEVSSVYFNIPNYFINEYGDPMNKQSSTSGLYSVTGEYYKYVTNGLVVPDQTTYDLYDDLVGKDISTISGYSSGYVAGYPSFYKLLSNEHEDGVSKSICDFTFNRQLGRITTYSKIESNCELLKFCNLMISSEEDYYCTNASFRESYNKFGRSKFTNTSTYNYVLSDKVERVGQRVPYDISVDDATLNSAITSYASTLENKKWYQKLFIDKDLLTDQDGYPDIKPIVELDDVSDLDDVDFSKTYFTTEEDAKEIKQFYDDYSDDNHIYLMRFEVNPYYAPVVVLSDKNNTQLASGLYFEKAVFEDFDVLEFTFKNAKGDFKKVAVSCDPIDVLGSVVSGNNTIDDDPNAPPKPSEDNLLLKILIILIGLIVLVLLIFVFVKIFGWFITLFGKSTEVFHKRSEYREQRRKERESGKTYRDKRKKEREKERDKRRAEKEAKKKEKEEGENSG